MANVKYAYYNTHYVNNDAKLIEVDNRYKQKEIYLSTSHAFSPFRFWEIAVAYDYQFNALNSDMPNFAFPKRHTNMLAIATSFQIWRMKIQGSYIKIGGRKHFKIVKERKEYDLHVKSVRNL